MLIRIQCVPGLTIEGNGRTIVDGDLSDGRIQKIELSPDFVTLTALENK